MRRLTRRNLLGCLATFPIIAAGLAGCAIKETRKTQLALPTSPMLLTSAPQTVQPTSKPTPTLFTLGSLYNLPLDLKAGPVFIPIELRIPSLQVDAPMLGVGLTAGNTMDAPKGPIDDPVWHTAFWYRGSGIPGSVGTATIAGHVDDPLGRPEIFAHLQNLHSNDLIVIHVKYTSIDIHFIVEQIKVYSLLEASDPTVLAQIFGSGPIAGTGPQLSSDGLSHLTLITCAGNIVHGRFDHYTVVYATRIS